MPGPYFPGQLPSDCGHYYPDVLRLRDEKRTNGKIYRIIDCYYCGRMEVKLNPRTLAPELRRQLNRKGVDLGAQEKDLAKVRKREFARLQALSVQNSPASSDGTRAKDGPSLRDRFRRLTRGRGL
jgi:hypothetical protein